jgi:hypothetical protein
MAASAWRWFVPVAGATRVHLHSSPRDPFLATATPIGQLVYLLARPKAREAGTTVSHPDRRDTVRPPSRRRADHRQNARLDCRRQRWARFDHRHSDTFSTLAENPFDLIY